MQIKEVTFVYKNLEDATDILINLPGIDFNLDCVQNIFKFLEKKKIAIEGEKITILGNHLSNIKEIYGTNTIFKLNKFITTLNLGNISELIYNKMFLNIEKFSNSGPNSKLPSKELNNQFINIYLDNNLNKIFTDSEVIDYLNNKFYSDNDKLTESNNIDFKKFSKELYDITENNIKLIFCRSINLETLDKPNRKIKTASFLNKSFTYRSKTIEDFFNNILGIKSTNQRNLLVNCFLDLQVYKSIRPELMNKINKVSIILNYKKNSKFDINNYRLIFLHSNIFKILDNCLCMEFADYLKDKNILPNPKVLINPIHVLVPTHWIPKAISRVKNTNNSILLDISSAYDNTSYDLIDNDFRVFLKSKKNISPENVDIFLDSYFFLIKNRKFKYNNNNITVSKGVPTGLASSGIIFSLIMEMILNRCELKLKEANLKHKIKNKKGDYLMLAYMDDVYLEIYDKDPKNIKLIIETFVDTMSSPPFNYTVNTSKCKISSDLLSIFNESSIDSNFIKNMEKLEFGDAFLGYFFANSAKDYLFYTFKQMKKRYPNGNMKDFMRICHKKKYNLLTPKEIEFRRRITGFLNFKIKGLQNFGYNIKIYELPNLLKTLYNKDLDSICHEIDTKIISTS
ncbi:Reverse transcriptase (RNA-dependent DNA polymerase) [seawater metagenome]|uniref:Reverse transcriptase (RNA-dependent DNA polymerase) n=1 Tax=seawater metagenome TaxID=1561972 RepID=A0A5E8CJ50_9ZZZZ